MGGLDLQYIQYAYEREGNGDIMAKIFSSSVFITQTDSQTVQSHEMN